MTNSRCGSAAEEPKVCQLTAGGNRIRTISPAEKETAVERGPAADHRRLARRPVLNDPIQLSYSIELRMANREKWGLQTVLLLGCTFKRAAFLCRHPEGCRAGLPVDLHRHLRQGGLRQAL